MKKISIIMLIVVLSVCSVAFAAFKLQDRRGNQNKYPVWRARLAQYTVATDSSAAVTKAFPVNGIFKAFTAVVNNNTNNVTVTVKITDEDGYALYTSEAIAENATTITSSLEVYVPTGSLVVVTPSGVPGAGGLTVDLTLYGI